jgi:hypothetical protein
MYPQPVGSGVGAVHDGAWDLRSSLRLRGRPRARGEYADDDVGRLAVQLGAQRSGRAGSGGGVHHSRQSAAGAQVREVKAVVRAGNRHEGGEDTVPGPLRTSEKGHAVQRAHSPARPFQQSAEAAFRHRMAEPDGAGEQQGPGHNAVIP